MRTTLLIAALVAVTACEGQPQQSGPSLGQVKDECGYSRRQFVEAWPCVRVGFAGAPVEPDLLSVYLSTGDYIAEQVREGKMTEAEARMAEAEALSRASSESARRTQAQQAVNAQRAAAMAGIIAATRPPPYVPPPPVFQQPAYRTPVICNRYGNQVICQ